MTNPICVWEWTLPQKDRNNYDVIATAAQLFGKFTFQLEKGTDTGYLHYQGRGSLYKKRRFTELKTLAASVGWTDIHFSPTVTENQKGPPFYCMKADTRVDGPWTEKDKPVYIPVQYRGILERLTPMQTEIWDSYEVAEWRKIHLVYDPVGNHGKSTIAALCELHNRGFDLPPCNDADKLVASVCDILMAKQERHPGLMFLDLPRSLDKNRLNGLYTAIEQIKKGKVFDLRYSYKEWWFDSPQLWIFTNTHPDLQRLSHDRWIIHSIHDSPHGHYLGNYTPPVFVPDVPMG